MSCTKEMKTFIRKWVLLSHFWQLAGEHLRSPVTFYFCPSSLWLVAPRTCILLSNISYQRHPSRLLLAETAVTGWCWLLSDSQTSQETEQDLGCYCWADLDSSAACLDSTKIHPLFQIVMQVLASLGHFYEALYFSFRSLVIARSCSIVRGGVSLVTLLFILKTLSLRSLLLLFGPERCPDMWHLPHTMSHPDG